MEFIKTVDLGRVEKNRQKSKYRKRQSVEQTNQQNKSTKEKPRKYTKGQNTVAKENNRAAWFAQAVLCVVASVGRNLNSCESQK